MSTKVNDTPRKQMRATDFRFVASDTFGINLNDNGLKIIFGIEDMDRETLEQSGVVLTLKSAKILAEIISLAVAKFEKDTDTIIPLNEDVLAEVGKALKAEKTHENE